MFHLKCLHDVLVFLENFHNEYLYHASLSSYSTISNGRNTVNRRFYYPCESSWKCVHKCLCIHKMVNMRGPINSLRTLKKVTKPLIYSSADLSNDKKSTSFSQASGCKKKFTQNTWGHKLWELHRLQNLDGVWSMDVFITWVE
jgi:hypothetical protein